MQVTIRISHPMLVLDNRCLRSPDSSVTCSDFTDASYAVSRGHGLARVEVRHKKPGTELKNRATVVHAAWFRHYVISRSRDGSDLCEQELVPNETARN